MKIQLRIDVKEALKDPTIISKIKAMNIRAYCDSCFKQSDEEDARHNKPCKFCGNTHYEIIDEEHILNNGHYGFRSTRYRNLDAYYDALSEMEAIRVTNISNSDYKRFIALGETCVAVFDKAMDESVEQDQRAGLTYRGAPPVIPFVTRLPDMYMRRGYWDEALTAYIRCSQSHYLSEFDFPKLIRELDEKRLCVEAISCIIATGEHSQKNIKKQLKDHPSQAISWALRFYQGFKREKKGNDYIVEAITTV